MKTKIALILNSIGGVDIYIRHLLNFINFEKYDIIVISNKCESLETVFNNVTFYSLEIKRNIDPFKDTATLFKTIKILKKERPQIIHCHSAKGGAIGRLAGNFLNIPTVYTPHAFSFLGYPDSLKKSIISTQRHC